MKLNHWGICVDSEKPVTGVISNNTISQFVADNEQINLALEEYREEHPDEEIDDWDSSTDTLLIGSWKKGEDGKYEPDTSGEYSAIIRELETQVVWSKYTKRVLLCSPCFPGQGDLDSEGKFLAFDVPPDARDEV